MSTLSKVCDSAWNSLSYLNVSEELFLVSKDIPKLLNVVDQALANRKKHKISMQNFSIQLPHCRWLSYVDNWIKILIACNIKELNLTVGRPIYEGKLEYNSLPEAIFVAKALNVLSLDGFNIELPAGDGFVHKLLQFRALSLRNFDGLANFQVGETLPKLKKVNLAFCPSVLQLVDIVAINLEDLKIYNRYGNLKVVKITACKALKNLFFNGVTIFLQPTKSCKVPLILLRDLNDYEDHELMQKMKKKRYTIGLVPEAARVVPSRH